jgi:hypothetical protein
VQGNVVRAKGVAQRIGFALYRSPLAQVKQLFLKCSFCAGPNLSAGERLVWRKPCHKRAAYFDETALTGF